MAPICDQLFNGCNHPVRVDAEYSSHFLLITMSAITLLKKI
jgi:hypothetical protein